MTTPLVLRDHADGVTTLTLNAPETINALSEAMMDALSAQLDAIAQDSAVRVVILRGAGKHFCAGHNLKEMTSHRGDEDGGAAYFHNLFRRCSRMMLQLTELPQPVIAEVTGIATAAGCQLVASCDLAVAASDARFATSGVNIGLFCATPMVALSRNVSAKPALAMLLTGDFVSADHARSIGLINEVAEPDQIAETTMALAKHIASKSPMAIRIGKQAFYAQGTLGSEEAYELAARAMADNMMACDAEAGIQAFIDKQPMPPWEGK